MDSSTLFHWSYWYILLYLSSIRAGTRSNWGNIARSDAELAEIVDGLNEQEANEKHIRSLAVIPPMLYNIEQREGQVRQQEW